MESRTKSSTNGTDHNAILVTEYEHGEVHRMATVDDMDGEIISSEQVDAPKNFGEVVEVSAIRQHGIKEPVCPYCERFILNRNLECPNCRQLDARDRRKP